MLSEDEILWKINMVLVNPIPSCQKLLDIITILQNARLVI